MPAPLGSVTVGNQTYECEEVGWHDVWGAVGGSPVGTQANYLCRLVRIDSTCGCTCGCDALGCANQPQGSPVKDFAAAPASGGSCGCGGGNGNSNGGGSPILGPSALNPTGAPGRSPPPSPYLVPPSAQGHQTQLRAVNLQLQRAAPPAGPGSRLGALEVWDGRTGNLMRQYSPPYVDQLAPWMVFTYNSLPQGAGAAGMSANWAMLFYQTAAASGSTTAVVNNGVGVSFTYTNKNASGVYTAPPGALNKLVQNASGTWTETAPDGTLMNYNTSGLLATIAKSSNVWTLAYDSSNRIRYILDPAGRRTSMTYAMFGAGTFLKRYTDAVGRITTLGYQLGTQTFLKTFTSPAGDVVTFTSSQVTGTIRSWTNPLGQRTTYNYAGTKELVSVTDPSGHITTIGYGPTQNYATARDPRGFITTYLSGSPVRGIIDPLTNRTSFTWSSGLMMQVQNPMAHRTSISYASLSGGQSLPQKILTPSGSRYTWVTAAMIRSRLWSIPLTTARRFFMIPAAIAALRSIHWAIAPAFCLRRADCSARPSMP
jgi:YD repeat-containing protein